MNNAGFGDWNFHRGPGAPHADGPLNCEALLDLQARYSPAMVERGRGAILNIASTSAFQPIPGTATYAATKAFVLSLSEATHSEPPARG